MQFLKSFQSKTKLATNSMEEGKQTANILRKFVHVVTIKTVKLIKVEKKIL